MNIGVMSEMNPGPSNGGESQQVPPRLLLVEDELIVALDVQQRLEQLGYRVVAHATTGDEALELAAAETLDLILMDVKIRGKWDGIETATRIREFLEIPIIYLTAYSDESTLQRAGTTAAYGYLIKPYEDRELRSSIEMALSKYQLEKRLKESEERYALASRASNGGIWDWNLKNSQVYYSPRWADMLGLDDKNLSGAPEEWFDRLHPDDRQPTTDALSAHLSGNTPVFECEYRILHQDGGYRWMQCRGMALFNPQQVPWRIAGSQVDISDRKHFEQELLRRALHDELTGLHNRAFFIDRLNEVLQQIRRTPARQAIILFLDLDHFKFYNDSFGHGWGDEILIQLAQRLKNSLHLSDTIARFGGDEFAILLDRVHDLHVAKQIVQRILDQVCIPFFIHGEEVFVTASLGFLVINSSYQSPEAILRDVDIAMYSAKNKGRARYEIFQNEMREKTLLRLDKAIELRKALDKGELAVYYQPIFALPNRNLVGFEALVRWLHPVKGLVLPGEFIPIAEETRLIIPLGEWVLKTACSQAKIWNQVSRKPLKISVNVSVNQLVDEHFVEMVENCLKENDLPAQLLELEITESMAIDYVDITFRCLERLQALGVNVAIDDFGRGYSSMDLLKRFRAKTLKIDRSFVSEMSADDLVIVSTMIQMAHRLRLKTTAEGVETVGQFQDLVKLACDQVQGFFLGEVLSPDLYQKLIETMD